MDIIFDVDGTLMCVAHRRPLLEQKRPDWKSWHYSMRYDTPIKEVVEMAKLLKQAGHRIIIASGRGNEHLDLTIEQLKDAGVEYDALYLRARKDYRKDTIVKAEMLEQMIEDGFEPTLAFDDRDCVVQMWRENGLRCFQVNEGAF